MSTVRYEIVLHGTVGDAVRGALDDLAIEFCRTQTTVRADLDQAGLTGLLDRFQQLGAEILEVHRLPAAAEIEP